MPLDSHGVYKYTEADNGTSVSELLNKAQDALSDANTPVKVAIGSAVTAGAGWAVTGGELARMGHHRMLAVSVRRSGAAITVPAHGNIANEVIASLTATADRPVITAPLTSGLTGRTATGSIRVGGSIEIGAVSPGGNINTDDTFDFVSTWIATGVVA